MARALGGSHKDIHIRRGHNLLIADVEAVGKGNGLASRQVRADGLIVDLRGAFIVDQNHDNIRLLRRVCDGVDLETVLGGLVPGLARAQADNHITAGVAQVQRMGMALRAIADDCDFLSLQNGDVTVFFIVHSCHFNIILSA